MKRRIRFGLTVSSLQPFATFLFKLSSSFCCPIDSSTSPVLILMTFLLPLSSPSSPPNSTRPSLATKSSINRCSKGKIATNGFWQFFFLHNFWTKKAIFLANISRNLLNTVSLPTDNTIILIFGYVVLNKINLIFNGYKLKKNFLNGTPLNGKTN